MSVAAPYPLHPCPTTLPWCLPNGPHTPPTHHPHTHVPLQGEARSDLHTLPSASHLDVIRGLFGPDLAASLLPVNLTGGSGDVGDDVTLDGPMGFVTQGYVSNLTYLGRKSVLVLFINGRPVEQGQLRRAIEAVYTAQNPKANKPWVFLDLKLPPRHVEVNMHPTKKEVGFLHQQAVIDDICR